jgi:hypothetical protein
MDHMRHQLMHVSDMTEQYKIQKYQAVTYKCKMHIRCDNFCAICIMVQYQFLVLLVDQQLCVGYLVLATYC